MPRAQNAHAYVNAGFLFRLNVNSGGKVLAKPTVVFGGINPQFVSIVVVVIVVIAAEAVVVVAVVTTTTMTTHVECANKSDTS